MSVIFQLSIVYWGNQGQVKGYKNGHSHPAALGQQGLLVKNNIQPISYFDTAGACQKVEKQGWVCCCDRLVLFENLHVTNEEGIQS